MDTGAALLRAVLACPEDDTARLVYADWLEENGEGPRAEFIRVQVEIAQHDAVHDPGEMCVCRELRRRERELLDGHWWRPKRRRGRAHFSRCGSPLSGYSLRRGFLHTISLTAPDFLENAKEIFSIQPVERVVLVGCVRGGSVGGARLYYHPWLPFQGTTLLDWLINGPHAFGSESEAVEALSRVCVRWGRDLAGL